MLIRLIVKNLLSFKELTEFNLLPGRVSRLPHHIHSAQGISVLKLSALYGANGAGKSNLVKALYLIKNYIISGIIPVEFITETFKFDEGSKNKGVFLGIEFLKMGIPFYYGITIRQGIVVDEELQISGLGKKEDLVLFRRTDTSDEPNLMIDFNPEVMSDKDASLFPSFLRTELLQRNQPVLHFLRTRQNPVFTNHKLAFEWFENDLVILYPESKPSALAIHLEMDKQLHSFSTEIMGSFKTGVREILIETQSIEDYFGANNKKEVELITADLKTSPHKIRYARNPYEEVLFVLEENKVKAKRLMFLHDEDNGSHPFTPAEESDGTRRLLEYLPALFAAIKTEKVIFIDEIERSIHPLIIKELIRKFSHDTLTKGQLIFTSHESNLLDQELFRPDEIWFAEKKPDGSTELYTLSEFKEHHTIDIRKGYLNGRYGAIPFMGNLKDLNWEKYA